MAKRHRCDKCGSVITEAKVVEIAQKAAQREIEVRRTREGERPRRQYR